MLVGAMVRDHVDDDPDACRVGFGDERVSVRERAEDRIDAAVVGDVVAGIGHRRWVPRVEPDGVDTQAGEVAQPCPHSGEIADPVPVAVRETAHVQLVDGGATPPGVPWRGWPGRSEFVHGEPAFSSIWARCRRPAATERTVCGEAPARWHAGSQPRMPPAVRPAMMLRWKIRKKTSVGIAAIADAAMMRFSGVPTVACQMPTFRVSLVGVYPYSASSGHRKSFQTATRLKIETTAMIGREIGSTICSRILV